MAIRAYVCEKCGKETDELYWREYPKAISCPQCGGKSLYRFLDTYYDKLKDRQPKRYKVDFRAGEYDWGAGRIWTSKQERETWLRTTGTTRRKDME